MSIKSVAYKASSSTTNDRKLDVSASRLFVKALERTKSQNEEVPKEKSEPMLLEGNEKMDVDNEKVRDRTLKDPVRQRNVREEVLKIIQSEAHERRRTSKRDRSANRSRHSSRERRRRSYSPRRRRSHRDRNQSRSVSRDRERESRKKRRSSNDRQKNVKVKEIEVTKTEVACMFWPFCKNGEQCIYVHPKDVCKNYPKCEKGDQCSEKHPEIPCRFPDSCSETICNFKHLNPEDIEKAVTTAKQTPCRYFPNCTNSACPFLHNYDIPCRFGLQCTRPDCKFTHPQKTTTQIKSLSSMLLPERALIPCRFSSQCARPNCPFQHPKPTILEEDQNQITGDYVSDLGSDYEVIDDLL
ncbi:hypothetical protein O9G_001691 [Rozella allomycis CSF55]|uniref:C3H1-type domain-containing protein n=1 Tax=Rozella allomycis (strain CSF55) TaxID=988480 RepID=A0A075B1W5_ROZAC|nr:hypothetical protein O9G_001691 [Rozella allomycis CSF55]|eukprot:EPZ34961.1 hypothetical protein O9G_001691 [Rozella allomycis CSF55]